jgi:hypothetical protein
MQFVPEYDEFMIYTTLSESLRTLEVEDIYITCIEQFEIGLSNLIKECIDGKN